MKSTFRRTIRAQLRDTRVLLNESKRGLILFLAVVLGGGLILWLFYTYPGLSGHPRFGEALYAAFALIFFETMLPFPEPWYLQILFFVIPLLGLAAIADGVLRFGAALLNKQARGQKWQVAMASTYSKHVIICGMGKLGYRTAEELRKYGREIVAIEQNPEGRFVEKALSAGIPVIIANARRSENLVKAGVKRADVVIVCTDDELTNLDIALDARDQNPDVKIVMRLFDPDLARRVQSGFGIHNVFSSSALTAPVIAAAAMWVNIKHSFYVGDLLLNLSEIAVAPGSPLIGRPVTALEQELDISVICYRANGVTDLRPHPEQALKAGDEILVLASLDALRQLQSLNEPADK